MCVVCYLQGGAVKQYKGLECPLDGFELVLFSLSGTVRQGSTKTRISQPVTFVTAHLSCETLIVAVTHSKLAGTGACYVCPCFAPLSDSA
jgi:hypothetical protein